MPAAPRFPLTVFLVEDSPSTRAALRVLIRQERLRSAGAAATARHALQEIGRRRPDFLIVDLALRGGEGLPVLRAAKWLWPGIQAAVFGRGLARAMSRRCRAAGADYVCAQTQGFSELRAALHAFVHQPRRQLSVRSVKRGSAP